MRKIYSMFLAALAFSAASCQVEIIEPNEAPVKEVMKITAGFDTDTKTTLVDGVKSWWNADDQVSVFDARTEDNNRLFTIVAEEDAVFPAATATFATEEDFAMPVNQTQEQALVVALYPYQENAFCNFMNPGDGDNLITGLNIPAAQKAVKDGFDASATFALATGKYTEKDELRFKNLYSLLKVTVAEAGVKEVKVVLISENNIVGDAQVVLNREVEETPVFVGGTLAVLETGSNEVTLTCADEAGFEPGVAYGIAIAPVTYTNIKVYLDGELVKDTTPAEAKTLEPNTFYNLKNLKKPGERGLAFSAGTATATLGAEFTAPTLSGETTGVVYSSTNETVATVDSETGAVTILAVGKTTIKAIAPKTTTLQAGEASYVLTVSEAPKTDRGLDFQLTSLQCYYGEEILVMPVVRIGITDGVVYSSSNTDVATVDPQTGVLTYGTTAGETTITASAPETETYLAGEASYRFIVTKANRNLAFAQILGTVTYGDDFTLPALTGAGDLTNAVYTVTAGDAATVTKVGVVTLVKAGTVTIKATVAEDETHLAGEATYTLTVNQGNRTISFNEEEIEITYGDKFTGQKLADVTDVSYEVISGDGAATVEAETGEVKIVKAGTVTIKATVAETDAYKVCYAEYKLTIKNPDIWGLCGSFNGWKPENAIDMTYDGDGWYQVTNVEIYKDDAFKFVKDKKWDTNYGGGNVNVGEEKTLSLNGGNIIVNKSGKHTLRFNPDEKKLTVQCTEEYSKTKYDLYVKPNSNWKQSDARFAAYFFGDGEAWVSMEECADGTYGVNKPAGKNYTSVIFVRMDPGKQTNDWNSTWSSQTNDLTIPSNGNNLYTIKDGTWNKGGGTWSKKD